MRVELQGQPPKRAEIERHVRLVVHRVRLQAYGILGFIAFLAALLNGIDPEGLLDSNVQAGFVFTIVWAVVVCATMSAVPQRLKAACSPFQPISPSQYPLAQKLCLKDPVSNAYRERVDAEGRPLIAAELDAMKNRAQAD